MVLCELALQGNQWYSFSVAPDMSLYCFCRMSMTKLKGKVVVRVYVCV